ncbi:MAG: AI-2E family transporter [Candidatus Promineifilaceae bacterium]
MTTPEIKLPSLTVRQIVQATLLVLLVAAAFYFLYHFHQVFLTFFVAIVLSTAIRPIIQFLYKLGVPKEIGVILIYLLLVLLIVAVILLLLPLVIRQSNLVIDTIPDTYQEIHQGMLENPNFFVWRLASELPENINLAPTPAPAEGEEAVIETVGHNLELIGLGARGIFITFAVLILAFYWTLDGEKNRTALIMIVPFERRESAREVVMEIQARLGAFVRGEALLGGIIGLLSFIAYTLIGLPYTFALAVMAGIMETVPVIGPILGAIPAVIVAYTVDPSKVLWVLLATAVIQQLENNFLVPRVMKQSVGVNPLVTLLALSAFGSLFGILGAVVAIPLAAVIQYLLDRFVLNTAVPDENTIPGRDRASVLRYEVQELTRDIRKSIRSKEIEPNEESDEVEDTIEAIAADLDALLTKSTQSEHPNNREDKVP